MEERKEKVRERNHVAREGTERRMVVITIQRMKIRMKIRKDEQNVNEMGKK